MKVNFGPKKLSKTELLYNPAPLPWMEKTQNWDKQRRTDEYFKCKKDPAYFLRTYGCIQHPKRGKIRFDLYPFQEDLLKTVAENKNTIVLKSRQLGISTITAGLAAWYAIFYPDKAILVIATKATTAKGFLDKVKLIYQYTPRWMKKPVREWNKMSLVLDNGSSVNVSTTTTDAGRSFAISLLIVDESAFISQMSDLWTACAPTISTGGKAIALSTPNGAQGWFYQTCMLAEEAQRLRESGIRLSNEQEATNFHMVTLPWHVHPERDQAWYDNMCKTFNFDLRKISQELDCSFAYSGQKVIMPEFLKRAKEDPRRVPIIAGHTDRLDEILDKHLPDIFNSYDIGDELDQENFRLGIRRCLESMLCIYKVPLPKDEITIAADVASGGGSDYSAFVGMDAKGFQVCGFKGKVDTKIFSIILYIIGMFFNEAGLAIERNSYGNDVILRLESDLGYSRVLTGLDNKPGFLTTGGGANTGGGSRNFFVSRLIGFVQNPVFKDAPVINDGRLIHEMEVFVWAEHNTGYGRKQKAEATVGENDDLVMSLAILATVLTTWDQNTQVFGVLSPEALAAVAENMLSQQDPALPQEDKRMQDGDIFSGLEDVYTGVNYDDNPAVLAQETLWNTFGIEHADRKKLKRQDHGMIVCFEK